MIDRTLIIDGPYLAHRSRHAPFQLHTSTGMNSTMIHSFMVSLHSLIKKFDPKKVIIAWESPGTKSWRKQLQPDYKPHKLIEQDFFFQMKELQQLLLLLGYKQFTSDTNEADDVIATLIGLLDNLPCIIFTTDKDIMQLITCKIIVVYNGKEIVDQIDVQNKFGIMPYQIPDLLAIWGDTSDNIEGIKGFGLKKSAKHIVDYGSVENLPDSPGFTKDLSLLYLNRNKILLNRQLAKLKNDCILKPIEKDNNITIDKVLDKYELKKIKEHINDYEAGMNVARL